MVCVGNQYLIAECLRSFDVWQLGALVQRMVHYQAAGPLASLHHATAMNQNHQFVGVAQVGCGAVDKRSVLVTGIQIEALQSILLQEVINVLSDYISNRFIATLVLQLARCGSKFKTLIAGQTSVRIDLPKLTVRYE